MVDTKLFVVGFKLSVLVNPEMFVVSPNFLWLGGKLLWLASNCLWLGEIFVVGRKFFAVIV